VPLDAASVNRTVGRARVVCEPRWIMSYAAGVPDARPELYDTRTNLVVHPMFTAAVEWQLLGALRPEPPMTLDELRRGVHVAHDVVIERAIEVGETVEITAEVVDVGRRATGATQTLLLHARDVAGGTVWRTTHTSLFLGVDVLGAPGWSTTPVRPSTARSSDREAENVIAERRSFIRPVDAHVYSECARIWNPIHTDVAVANRLGLAAPILHGTATLARAVSIVTELVDVPLAAVRRVACRFGAVVGLGADIRVRLLDTSSSRLGFEVRNARGERAVRDGLIAFGP